MLGGGLGRIALRIATALVLVFIYIPLTLVVIYAFNESGTSVWPPSGFSLKWIGEAIANTGLQQAFLTSVVCALAATVVAMVLGALASLAVSRYSFFGRETVSFVLILAIALPGVVTGPSATSRSSSATRRSASSSSTTTRSPGCAGCRARSRRPRPTLARTPSRPSGT
jgi:putative spermidine/putrescine transport system permease protein